MKRYLLSLLICLLPFAATAQLSEAAWLVGTGVSAGAKALKNRANKPGEFIGYFKVGQDSIPMKRTPESKIRGEAANDIRKLEAYLERVHKLYQQPQTESICPDSQIGDHLIRLIQTQQPKWDVAPYQQELAFYQKQHRDRYEAARFGEQRAREAIALRQQRRQDSLNVIEQRQLHRADSVEKAALAVVRRERARADSAAELTRRARAIDNNINLLTPAGLKAMQPKTATPKAASKPAPKPKTQGAVVYMCNSGNTVKYHASPSCRGLNRCNAPVVKISKAEAVQSMDPCKFCY